MAPWRQAWRPAAKRLLGLIVTFVFVFFVLLGFMDRLWVGYSNPLDHLRRIVGYGVDLRRPDGPSEIESYPWQWLWNDQQIPYMIVNQQTESDDGTILEQRPIVEFRGAMNPFVLQLWPLGLAFAGYAWWRRQPGHAIGTLALAWFACTYLPFWLATLLTQRISYLFYFLPTVPAVALAGGYFLLRSGLPRAVVWAYGVAVLLGFYGYFPFKFYGFSGS
jgi:polyferredoxin